MHPIERLTSHVPPVCLVHWHKRVVTVLICPISIVTHIVKRQSRGNSSLIARDPAMGPEYRVWVDRGYTDGNKRGFRSKCGRDGAQCAEISLVGFPEERFTVCENQAAVEVLSELP